MLLELLEWHCDRPTTAIWAQDAQRDWHQRLSFGVHADANMDRIVHNTIWVETGGHNVREHTAAQVACVLST
ncbi:ATP-binding protein [Cryobacterium melibiosiphilum]|uniref:ATP-binding protein n=1 Tax=Cryobacterium melibiosiphilum TaxID=995039 RepID=UPI001F420977|nr:ATP-binding protein [Cryobacterium melibiosiphilum]